MLEKSPIGKRVPSVAVAAGLRLVQGIRQPQIPRFIVAVMAVDTVPLTHISPWFHSWERGSGELISEGKGEEYAGPNYCKSELLCSHPYIPIGETARPNQTSISEAFWKWLKFQ